MFIAIYHKMIVKNPLDPFQYSLHGTQPRRQPSGQSFDEIITKLSPEFVSIYKQSARAEEYGLNQVCGIGYRKSLEFLIKDYLVSKNPERREEILKKPLGQCIKDDISDTRIKNMAKLATWLGNDETHYIRKHEDMNIDDLKKLIEATRYWISMESTTSDYEDRLT
ncbi:DUF4145 domain-containing protein [Paenibacillus piri]|uniref:DUF4145 domain-containing protein n=1 Tax=Paenibacillus piri TaxID=2547395 RepID=A0A4R5KCF7_9BACL|nr:DUF4145 domain-containing protein [Paenibacillus piri]